MKLYTRSYLTSKSAFSITLLVVTLTIVAVWLFGLGQHRTLYINSVVSTSILSLAFFLFLSINLYRGIKMKDDLGKITDGIKKSNFPDFSKGMDFPSEAPDLSAAEGLGEIVLGIILWILVSVVLLIVIWFFGAILWSMILVFAAMLYWIFFRALRLVFKNSKKCKDDLAESLKYAFFYTLLYNFWIYAIIFSTHYLM